MAISNPYNYSMPKNSFTMKSRFENKQKQRNKNMEKKSDNKFDQYKEQAILTASPEELTLMLYDGAIRFLKKAKIHIEENNIEKINNSLLRAQNIISELNITLNMNYEISKNLRELYDFMIRRIVDSNLKKDANIVDEVLELLEDLRDTWKEAMKTAKIRV